MDIIDGDFILILALVGLFFWFVVKPVAKIFLEGFKQGLEDARQQREKDRIHLDRMKDPHYRHEKYIDSLIHVTRALEENYPAMRYPLPASAFIDRFGKTILSWLAYSLEKVHGEYKEIPLPPGTVDLYPGSVYLLDMEGHDIPCVLLDSDPSTHDETMFCFNSPDFVQPKDQVWVFMPLPHPEGGYHPIQRTVCAVPIARLTLLVKVDWPTDKEYVYEQYAGIVD